MNTKASAGNRGKSVRSDAWVEVRRNDSGDNTITISGKAQTYYPIATRELIEAGIEHFCLQSVDLVVEDQGALPFVLMARLETAVRRFSPGSPSIPGSRLRDHPPRNQHGTAIDAAVFTCPGICLNT